MRFRTILLTVLVVLAGRPSRGQHAYFVASSPLGGGNGSPSHPWTVTQLLRVPLGPGDTVYFQGGDTLAGPLTLQDVSGTAAHPVVLAGRGPGRALLRGGDGLALKLVNCRHVQVINLSFLGSGRKTGNHSDGVRLENCRDMRLSRLDISGFQKAGLMIYNSQRLEIDSLFAHDNGAVGILVEGDYQQRSSRDIHLRDCRADNNPGDPTNLQNHSGNGILVGNCRHVLIEYCSATNNGWDMPRVGNGPVGIWAYEADSVTIQYCISFRNKTAAGAADGGGFDLDGGVTNSVIQYCLSYENQGSGYGIFQYYSASPWYNNQVRYCISYNDGQVTDQAAGMYIWNGWNGDSTFTDFYAYQNLFFNDRKYAFSFSPLSQHRRFYFYNNVFVAGDQSPLYFGVDSSHSDRFLGNLWLRKSGGFAQDGFTDFAQWSRTTGYERVNGRLAGTTSPMGLFRLAGPPAITDPHRLRADSWIHALCPNTLPACGLDRRAAGLPGTLRKDTDFFGRRLDAGHPVRPGICP